MAILKRKLDVNALVPTRNVRRRLKLEEVESVQKVTPILRRRKRYSSCTSIRPLSPLPTNGTAENSCDTHSDDDESPTKATTVTPTKSTTRIRFKNTVSVVHIPSRLQYPEDMKKTLWGNLEEIASNASRNTLEFAFENYDWRAAVECEDMHVTESGERIHPVHARRTYSTMPSKYASEDEEEDYDDDDVSDADPVDARDFSETPCSDWFES